MNLEIERIMCMSHNAYKTMKSRVKAQQIGCPG